MELINAIKGRRTIRKFKEKPLSRKILFKIIEMGSFAPSACNKQAWEFIVVDSKKIKEKLLKKANFPLIDKIPAIIFTLYDGRINKERYANIQSAAAAIQNMLLYSSSIGIGSWWIAAYGNEEKIREILNVPKHMMIIAAIGFGYPAVNPTTPKRKPLKEIVHFNEFKGLIKSEDPDEWSFDKIVKFASHSIRATSPFIGYRYIFKHELKNIVQFVISNIKGRNGLSLFDCSGTELFSIAEKLKNVSFLSYVFSKEIADWLKGRANFLKIKNVRFEVVKNINLGREIFDFALCLNVLNRVCNRDEIVKKIYEVLKPKGKFLISIVNSLSYHGIYRKKRIGQFGPEKPLSISYMKSLLKKNGFKIKKIVGLNLFPSEEIIGSMELKTRYFKIIKLFASKKTESFKTEGFLKNFCRLIIFYCEK